MNDLIALQKDLESKRKEAIRRFVEPTDTGYSLFERATQRALELLGGTRDITLVEVPIYLRENGSDVLFERPDCPSHYRSNLTVRFEKSAGSAAEPLGKLTIKGVSPRAKEDSPLAIAMSTYNKSATLVPYSAVQTPVPQ